MRGLACRGGGGSDDVGNVSSLDSVVVICNTSAEQQPAAGDTCLAVGVDERTPLLRDRKKSYGGNNNNNYNSNSSTAEHNKPEEELCELRLIAFALALLLGVTVALYLLIIDTRRPTVGYALDLVAYELWSGGMALPLGAALNHTIVANVLITRTGTGDCTEPPRCLGLLQQLQATAAELPYNFLIGSDGLTYEVRGWDHESAGYAALLPQNASFVVGLLGELGGSLAASHAQLQALLSLLRESVRRKKLLAAHRLFALRNGSAAPLDATALTQWPGRLVGD